jgi:AcrR family transcriptional regulator
MLAPFVGLPTFCTKWNMNQTVQWIMASSQARDRLLAAAVDQAMRDGIADLSLRELAAAIGTSHRMLLYHFGSREGLLEAVARAVQEAQRTRLPDWMFTPDGARYAWQHFSHPKLWPQERLFFELYAHALLGRPGTEGFLEANVEPSISAMTEALARTGLDESTARAQARLAMAVIRGLLLDLLATGDLEGTTAAFEQYVQHAEAFQRAQQEELLRSLLPASAGRETCGPIGGILERPQAVPVLGGDGVGIVEAILIEQRHPVLAQAGLREARQYGGQFLRGGPGLAGSDDAVREADVVGLGRGHRPAGQDQVHRPALPDEPRQPERAAVDERHAPAAAEDTEGRVGLHHPQVTPERELKAARHGVSGDGGDDGLAQLHAGAAERSGLSRRVNPVAGRRADRLQVGARAEVPALTPEHRDRCGIVVLELSERGRQLRRSPPVDSVARL